MSRRLLSQLVALAAWLHFMRHLTSLLQLGRQKPCGQERSYWPTRAFIGLAAASVLGLLMSSARAEEGVTPDAVVITRIIALDGPAGAKAREQEAALEAYFGAVNSAGGIHGRRVVLRTTNADLRT